MKPVLFLSLVFATFAMAHCSTAQDSGQRGITASREEALDSRAFFEEVAGKYKIAKAGGEVPHDPETATASFKVTAAIGEVTMPYCLPSGGCDPGYLDFPYTETKVFVTRLPEGKSEYRLVFNDGSVVQNFTATRVGNSLVFRNLQYALTETEIGTLVHELEKITVE